MLARVPRQREQPVRQVTTVRRAFPQFRWKMTRSGGVDWSGDLQPTPDSPRYHLRLLHEPDRVPRTWVVSPRLRSDAPHRYPDDQSLCLYWPKRWSWNHRESLAETIIPWAALWLYYYEIWLFTDEWPAPSSPHGPGTSKEAA